MDEKFKKLPATSSKWTDSLTSEQIPAQYQQLANTIGMQQLLALVEQFGGMNVYVPKRDALLRNVRDKLIREEYNGFNTDELARKYDLSARWVLEICGKLEQCPGQVDMLDQLDTG